MKIRDKWFFQCLDAWKASVLYIKRQDKILIGGLLFGIALTAGGCSLNTNEHNPLSGAEEQKASGSENKEDLWYTTEEEAGTVALDLLQKKYGRTFTLEGTPRYKLEKGVRTFTSDILDQDGLSASVTLPQKKELGVQESLGSGVFWMTDTYSETWYTKMAREAAEPCLRMAPVDRYCISLNNCGHAGADLDQSPDEFFETPETWIKATVILPDGQSEEEYIRRIRETGEALQKQPYPFDLTVYANGVNIYSVILEERGSDYKAATFTEDEIGILLDMQNDSPIPEEQFLQDPYYDG